MIPARPSWMRFPPPEPPDVPSAFDGAIVTLPGFAPVPPMTNAFCTIESAIRLAPAETTVSPAPVMPATC